MGDRVATETVIRLGVFVGIFAILSTTEFFAPRIASILSPDPIFIVLIEKVFNKSFNGRIERGVVKMTCFCIGSIPGNIDEVYLGIPSMRTVVIDERRHRDKPHI
jgi:hypothetical protein